MSVKRTIPAGVLDSAMASLATFIVGVQAVRVLQPESLGAYGLVFSGFTLLMEVPARLVLLPAEIEAARRPRAQRPGLLPAALRAAALPVAVSGTLLLALRWFIPAEVPADVVTPLLLTAAVCTMISPVQDHLRKMLHTADRSYTAAAVSAIQLAAVVAALVVLATAGIGVAWHPFGALAVANAVSVGAALALWPWQQTAVPEDTPGFSQLAAVGGWHLLAGAAPKGGTLAAVTVVAHLAGATALGYAEGARVLARPVAVLSQGIKATIGPPLMRAAANRDAATARRLSRTYALVVGACGGLYLAGAAVDWRLNPLPELLPTAYAVPGLAAAMIAVFTLDRVAGSGAGLQLFGAGRARSFAAVESAAGAGQAVAGAAAGLLGAFAVPLGYLVASGIRRPWVALLVRRMYRESPSAGGAGAGPPPDASPLPIRAPLDGG